ncbi:NADPH-dependent FMN reductase [Salmonella enterica subsp. enterica serovar Javiana]|nr:NADPH-dependent FMN reductase [Salmonella enterica subsp. enterica serovar Javiana]
MSTPTSTTRISRRLVVVQAGVGQPSSTRLLAERLATSTADALLERGEESHVEVVDLRLHVHDLANAMVTGFATGPLAEAVESVRGADGVIVASPVYQASYSGLFKSFVDILDADALRGTPVLLAATAGTARHSLVLEHAMRPLFAHLKAVTVPTAVFAASEDWGAGGVAEGLAARVEVAAAELADLVSEAGSARRAPARLDGELADPVPFEQLLAG